MLVNACIPPALTLSLHLQASNGQFSLSFWFTHNHCENLAATGPDGWEPLYHHGGEECATCPWQSIGVFIACNSSLIMDRGRSTETVSNINSLMVYMVDDDGQMAEVSVPFTMDDSRDATGSEDHLGAADGRVLSHWIHFGLSVNRDKMTIYIDGVPAREFGTDKPPQGYGMTNLAAGHLSSWALRRSDGEITLDAPLGDISLGASHRHKPFIQSLCLQCLERILSVCGVCSGRPRRGSVPRPLPRRIGGERQNLIPYACRCAPAKQLTGDVSACSNRRSSTATLPRLESSAGPSTSPR